jgi:peptidyl-prolyl cis-trans isomerase D
MFDEALAKMRRAENPELTAKQARQAGLIERTLDTAVKRDLIDQDIKRLGIAVPATAIMKMLADQPQFRTKDGSFNKDLFRLFLEKQGLNERSFIAQTQQELSRQLLLSAISGTPTVAKTEIDAVYKARAQKRILDVITIDPTKITGIPAPNDKALHDYYTNNPAMFTAPEYRALTIAVLSTDALTKDIKISDDQLKKGYDDKREQLANPEQRDLIQIVSQDEAKAKAIAAQARASGNLTTAAKTAGETAIPLDKMEDKDLLPELSKSVFALSQGQISDPVKTQLGWHVVQVKKIIPAGTPDFDSVKDKLREEMKRDQAIEAATRTINQLDDELAAGHSLDDIADGLKLRVIKIPSIDATGLLPNGKEPTELPSREAVLKDAFAQNNGDTSPIGDDKAGNYYVVHTDQITPSAERPFDEIKTSVAEEWKAHEQVLKAQKLAETIAKQLRDGKAVKDIADSEGVSTRQSKPISQLGDTDPLLPPSILAQVFKMKKGEVTTTTDAAFSDRNQVVARLQSITDADPAANDPRKSRIAGDIKQNIGNELLDQYVAHLYDVFPVKIDSAAVDRLRGQDQ